MAKKAPALDKDLDHLYAQRLEDFVSARNALVARLQKEGRKKDAAQIKALRKPSASAWIVNQLIRQRRGAVDALLEAGGRMRAVQREAVRGTGGGNLRSAMQAERKALERLRRAIEELAASSKRRGNPAVTDRAVASLRAIAEGAEAPGFQEGRLTEDIASPGLEAMAKALGRAVRATPPPVKATPRRVEESRHAQSPRVTTKQRKGGEARQRKQAERREDAEARRRKQAEARAQRIEKVEATAQRRKQAKVRAQSIEKAEETLRHAEAEARALEAEMREAERDAKQAEQEAKRAMSEAKRAAQKAEQRDRIRAAKAEEAALAKQEVRLARRAFDKARREQAS